jgi:hypothetical protein
MFFHIFGLYTSAIALEGEANVWDVNPTAQGWKGKPCMGCPFTKP